jgi:transforming growth factor-beta-induced protein
VPIRPPTPAPTFAGSFQQSFSQSPSAFDSNGGGTTILDFVSNSPDLASLTAALFRVPELAEELITGGPYTLFAPNNAAFADVPLDIVDKLFSDFNFIPQLQDLLLLHLTTGTFLEADLELVPGILSANGEAFSVDFPPLTIADNNVVDGDNIVSNGVVHVIDGVLIPSWVFNSLDDRIFFDDDLSTLFSLLVTAGIDLSNPSSALTVAAPTNAAFDLLPQATIDFLLTTEGLPTLTRILTYHVFFGILASSILIEGFVPTLEGGLVFVGISPIMFNSANAVEVDILANNGVLHKIDQVLDPNDSP